MKLLLVDDDRIAALARTHSAGAVVSAAGGAGRELWFARITSPATVGSARASTRLRRRVNDVDRRLCDRRLSVE
jgi:hypothetical protein